MGGGGISGLVSALELSEDASLNLTIIEGSDMCGGKMKEYFDKKKKRFEEHSIRALASTYFALFDVFYRARILDALTAADDYIFYERTGKIVAVDRTETLKLEIFKALVKTFDLSITNMMTLAKKITHHINASEENRKELANKKQLKSLVLTICRRF